MLESLKFKLKSSKVLFIIGVWVTIVIVGFGVFRESKNDGNSFVQESKALFFGEKSQILRNYFKFILFYQFLDNVVKFFVLLFVLVVNLYYNAKLVEGIVHRLPYKILPWIVINIVNLVQAAVYFVKVDDMIGYLMLIMFCYVWMVMITIFVETRKGTEEEHMECTPNSDVGYNNFSSENENHNQ